MRVSMASIVSLTANLEKRRIPDISALGIALTPQPKRTSLSSPDASQSRCSPRPGRHLLSTTFEEKKKVFETCEQLGSNILPVLW